MIRAGTTIHSKATAQKKTRAEDKSAVKLEHFAAFKRIAEAKTNGAQNGMSEARIKDAAVEYRYGLIGRVFFHIKRLFVSSKETSAADRKAAIQKLIADVNTLGTFIDETCSKQATESSLKTDKESLKMSSQRRTREGQIRKKCAEIFPGATCAFPTSHYSEDAPIVRFDNIFAVLVIFENTVIEFGVPEAASMAPAGAPGPAPRP